MCLIGKIRFRDTFKQKKREIEGFTQFNNELRNRLK